MGKSWYIGIQMLYVKNVKWQNPEQLFVAEVLINKVNSKYCGIKGMMKIENGIKKNGMIGMTFRLWKICAMVNCLNS